MFVPNQMITVPCASASSILNYYESLLDHHSLADLAQAMGCTRQNVHQALSAIRTDPSHRVNRLLLDYLNLTHHNLYFTKRL